MITNSINKIWKVRTVKNYHEAHNHLVIGRVVEVNEVFLKLCGRTYHFRRNILTARDVIVGIEANRVVPWNRVEIVNELPTSFDYKEAVLSMDKDGRVVLNDGNYICPICEKSDKGF